MTGSPSPPRNRDTKAFVKFRRDAWWEMPRRSVPARLLLLDLCAHAWVKDGGLIAGSIRSLHEELRWTKSSFVAALDKLVEAGEVEWVNRSDNQHVEPSVLRIVRFAEITGYQSDPTSRLWQRYGGAVPGGVSGAVPGGVPESGTPDRPPPAGTQGGAGPYETYETYETRTTTEASNSAARGGALLTPMFAAVIEAKNLGEEANTACEHRIRESITLRGVGPTAWQCGRLRARGFAPLNAYTFIDPDLDVYGYDDDGEVRRHARDYDLRIDELIRFGAEGDVLTIAAAIEGARSVTRPAQRRRWIDPLGDAWEIVEWDTPGDVLAFWMDRRHPEAA